jgi:fumarate hydratase subunit alpha
LREIEAAAVTEAVRDLCIEANTRLPQDHLSALRRALDDEESPLGREVIERLLENAEVARERCIASARTPATRSSSSNWEAGAHRRG